MVHFGETKTVAIEDPLVADDFKDSDYESGPSSDTTSITSTIRTYIYENGRRYHRSGVIAMPNDETEQNRLDLYHHLHLALMDEKLHTAPVGPHCHRILDCGTGTGIWALDMASEYPHAVVYGVDLSPIQPSWVFPNVKFEVDDLEKDWTWPDNYFDFIHSRTMLNNIRDWKHYTTEMFRTTSPGAYVQLSESEFILHSDDDTYTPETYVHQWMTKHKECTVKAGINLPTAADILQYLEDAGFVNIEARPVKTPWGTWPRGKRLKRLGAIMTMVLETGFSAYGLMLFTRFGGMGDQEAQEFNEKVYKEILSKRVHVYNHTWVITAQKPAKKKK